MLAGDLAGEGDVIQVVSRAFDVLRCFEGHEARLGNLEISNRCGLPTGSRIAMASTAAGHAYTAALAPEVGDAFLAEMEREVSDGAKLLRPRIEDNRRFLREHGYVVACGLWSPHINGLAVPLWSPQYQTFVVVTIGLLAAMFDEKRLHREVAPQMIQLGAAIAGLLEGAEGDLFNNRLERKPLAVRTADKIVKTEETNDLEARTRRPRSARSIRARDGRR